MNGCPRNMKFMQPPLAAIFFMTHFHRAGGPWPPQPPGSATGINADLIEHYFSHLKIGEIVTHLESFLMHSWIWKFLRLVIICENKGMFHKYYFS